MVEEQIVKEFLSNRRNFAKLGIDTVSIIIGVQLALMARFADEWVKYGKKEYVLIYGSFFLLFYFIKRDGIKSWSFTNSIDVLNLLYTHMLTCLVTVGYLLVVGINHSKGVILLTLVFTIIVQLMGRFIFRLNYSNTRVKNRDKGALKKRVLIYGAGAVGVSLLKESQINRDFLYEIVGFIDDDLRKRGTVINGIKVLGNIQELEEIVKAKRVEKIIIAINNIDSEKVSEIVERVRKRDINVKILPQLGNIIRDLSLLNQVRDVSIEDLLGRDEISINGDEIRGLIRGKVVFVTGGAGSIGSELARQIAKYSPKKLVTIDVNENDLYFLELELKRKYKDLSLVSEICNIRERKKVEILFDRYKPEVVFHAAAHKHVPLMEHNPEEAIKNNIFGTKNLSEMAIKYGVDRFVLISTDKAVNPTNIMGATKRACELVVEDMSKRSKTKFMAVRFGNVLGSNGSVIPIFKKLISEGKNLTLTHENITRYFMTIPEAAQLVMEAGAMGDGGELFILDMGEPIKIIDLAKTMIKLSGANVKIDIIGLRPGEKLYEELLYDVTKAIKTENNKIFITKLDEGEIDLNYHLNILKKAIEKPNQRELKELMKKFVVTYKEGNIEKHTAISA